MLAAGLAAQLAKYLIEPHIDLDTFLGAFAQLSASGAKDRSPKPRDRKSNNSSGYFRRRRKNPTSPDPSPRVTQVEGSGTAMAKFERTMSFGENTLVMP